ncbi:cupredoxin family protein [Mesorhizobium sp. Z1-4]|uniref:cupredoxin domain-containing protein n=1 Tax=Mesorhizobium sp. Z1-4 TaxID=2448478 RepID=UPI000FDC0EBC|nr:cupredoxin family protein [Mesorhizobium sp. Z1-4]
MVKTVTRILPLAAAIGAALLLGAVAARADAGHGNGSVPFGKPGHAAQVDRTIELDVDGMSYSMEKLDVKAGETIRFVIRNESEIEHDFTIGDKATQKSHRAEMAEMMEHMGPGSATMEHDDPNAVFLEAGQTRELIWIFDKAGNFEFACNVPGHYEAGMHGPITVGDNDA